MGTLTKVLRGALLFLIVSIPLPSGAALIDFGQVETSELSSTVVLVKAVGGAASPAPSPLLAAALTRWSSGEAASLGYVHRWALSSGTHGWQVGLGAGVNTFRNPAEGSGSSQTALSARLQTEFMGPAPGGSYYGLVQFSTFRDAWFGSIQYNPSQWPAGFEIAGYSERDFQSVTTSLRIPLGVDRWSVRVGAIRALQQHRPFIGLTYNAF
jgi:hypothetical protein